jgi:uncharacterized damage-inducible protein DinB
MRADGGCHCGAVRFRVELDGNEALDCNCSVCAKKGFVHVIVPEAKFTLVSGGDRLATYTFGTHTAKHMFCSTCGVHAFYRPRSHPDAWDVNARCFDDVPLSHWRIRAFDGANWEHAAAALRGPSANEVMRMLARNNAWSNERLHDAVAQLDAGAYRATGRTSFFPSIHVTLVHILFVDLYYVACLEGRDDGATVWADHERFERDASFAELRTAQRAVDTRLLAACDGDLAADVRMPRSDRVQVESRANVLLHVVQHQIHHRGQVHAMLSGTAVAPPQLDEYFVP